LVPVLEQARSTEALIEALKDDPAAPAFWREAETAIANCIKSKLRHTLNVSTRLFAMDGSALSETIPCGKGETP